MSLPANVSGVVVTDLTKAYAGVPVLRGLSFAVQRGEVLGVLGRNGAGKTTLLECIMGLRTADRGAVRIADVDALRSPTEAREFLGAQLQSATLQDNLTPLQALRYFGSFYARARTAEAMLAEFQLTEKSHAPFASLSGGQKQRLFLALAFIHDPAVVILDEPTAGLDPHARRELHGLIHTAKARGVAIILATHDLEEAEGLCDRVAILHDGRFAVVGEPRDLIAASSGKKRIILATAAPVTAAQFAGDGNIVVVTNEALPTTPANAVARPTASVAETPHRLVIECTDVERGLATVIERLVKDGNRLHEVQILRPNLADVFFERTGTPWQHDHTNGARASLTAARATAPTPDRPKPRRPDEP
jgi:ABC-2 type transport system ATP-binding protein